MIDEALFAGIPHDGAEGPQDLFIVGNRDPVFIALVRDKSLNRIKIDRCDGRFTIVRDQVILHMAPIAVISAVPGGAYRQHHEAAFLAAAGVDRAMTSMTAI